MAHSYNPMMVWDGSKWTEGTKKVWDGKAWVASPSLKYWDGATWQFKAPAPIGYPSFEKANSSVYGARDYIGIPHPAGKIVTDYVVSVCASSTVKPQIVEPWMLNQTQQLATGTWVSVAVWPYDGRPGDIVWDVTGSKQATVMNLLYRGGDWAAPSMTPVKEIRQFERVNRVPLNSPVDFTSVFLVLAESTDLTGFAWPDGVTGRASQLGKFGSRNISLIASDTPGSGSSAGDLVLDTTVQAAACITIQLPGVNDGKPTWILGDSTASVLGTTTVLG
ncbi:hypothetical protein [Streptomyces sp. NPDC002790]|uniref:hypothetical protein n=1 Tax=Streptomyces sp. NPDC002790 TaxID=3154431 RepID=UPI00331CF182